MLNVNIVHETPFEYRQFHVGSSIFLVAEYFSLVLQMSSCFQQGKKARLGVLNLCARGR